jgi:hypothetical protein
LSSALVNQCSLLWIDLTARSPNLFDRRAGSLGTAPPAFKIDATAPRFSRFSAE